MAQADRGWDLWARPPGTALLQKDLRGQDAVQGTVLERQPGEGALLAVPALDKGLVALPRVCVCVCV